MKIDKSHIWIWGGPTPLWGGTVEKDCLVKGADYFSAENVVYVYGSNNNEMLDLLKKFKKVICQITHINRSTPGISPDDDIADAENLSKLSLKYKNIIGGIIDDFSEKIFSPMKLKAINEALKKHNPHLKLYTVVYTDNEGFIINNSIKKYLKYIDAINLWVWHKSSLEQIDLDLERFKKIFNNKPILLGIFMHDYGDSDKAMPVDLLRWQFNRAKRYIQSGKIEGSVILGDREINKHPVQAEWIKKYLLKEFIK